MKISEIKNQASLSLEGNLFKAILMTLFYTLINLLTQFILTKLDTVFTNANTLFSMIQSIVNIALLPFSYGLIVSLIELTKNKNIGLTNFINVGLLNYTKTIRIFFGIFLRILGYVALFSIALILFSIDFSNSAIILLLLILLLSSIILLFIKSLDFALVLFINYDDPKLSVKKIIKKSKELMEKNKLKFVLLILSFILWFIILVLLENILSYFINPTYSTYISNALFAIITPIITISQYIFYDSLANAKQIKE